MQLVGELNQDQFDNLAKLCLDLAKGSFAIALLTTPNLRENLTAVVLKIFISLIVGLVFTYLSLVLLKMKELVK